MLTAKAKKELTTESVHYEVRCEDLVVSTEDYENSSKLQNQLKQIYPDKEVSITEVKITTYKFSVK